MLACQTMLNQNITQTSRHERLAIRLSDILMRLNNGERLDIRNLPEEYKVTTRTIQRDLNERLVFLSFCEFGPRFYKLDKSVKGFLKESDIESFAKLTGITGLIPKLKNSIVKEQLPHTTHVKGFSYENIDSKTEDFEAICSAIETGNFIQFSYRKSGSKTLKNYVLAPYHLINKNGIWYVIGLNNKQQKTFCFNQIGDLKPLDRKFTINQTILTRIKQSDSLHHSAHNNTVIIKINAQVAEYFQRRALLPNQKTLTPQTNGDIHITCENVSPTEIIAIVQYWLPHASIIAPQQWQETLISHLNQYLNPEK